MKNFAKIIAIAAIAALAAFSCAPELEVTELDWEAANDGNDVTQNSDLVGNKDVLPKFGFGGFTVSGTAETSGQKTDKDPLINIDFSSTRTETPIADVVGKGDFKEIEAELKKFLSFYVFTQAATMPDPGKAGTLSEEIPYTVEGRKGNTIVVKLTKDFISNTQSNPTLSFSNVIAKVSGKDFTYARGLTVDINNDGVPGGADDVYYDEITISGSGITAFIKPEQKDWHFTLDAVPNLIFTGTDLTTAESIDVTAATFSSRGLDNRDEENAIKNTVMKKFADQFYLQKYEGSWKDEVRSGFKEPATPTGVGSIVFASVKQEHLKPYRVVWKGSANSKTDEAYFGYQQNIRFVGDPIVENRRHDYARTLVTGASRLLSNSNLINFSAKDQIHKQNDQFVGLESYDSSDRNIVLTVYFNPVTETTGGVVEYYWLDDNADFKANFKIYQSIGGETEFYDATDLVEIPCKFSLENNPNLTYITNNPAIRKHLQDTNGRNVLRITMDPAFKIPFPGDPTADPPEPASPTVFFYINDKIGFKDGKTKFGGDHEHDFFEAYEIVIEK